MQGTSIECKAISEGFREVENPNFGVELIIWYKNIPLDLHILGINVTYTLQFKLLTEKICVVLFCLQPLQLLRY